MSKVKINYSLKNKEKFDKHVIGIKNGNHLIFNDDDSILNLEILDNYVILKRENKEIISEIYFKQNSCCKYYLKEYHRYIDININLISLKIEENNLKIIYQIDNEEFEFNLHYEVI